MGNVWEPCRRPSDSFASGLLQFNFGDVRLIDMWKSLCIKIINVKSTHTHTRSGCFPVIHHPPSCILGQKWAIYAQKKLKKSELQRMSTQNIKDSDRKGEGGGLMGKRKTWICPGVRKTLRPTHNMMKWNVKTHFLAFHLQYLIIGERIFCIVWNNSPWCTSPAWQTPVY